jgi:hypothetical protein
LFYSKQQIQRQFQQSQTDYLTSNNNCHSKWEPVKAQPLSLLALLATTRQRRAKEAKPQEAHTRQTEVAGLILTPTLGQRNNRSKFISIQCIHHLREWKKSTTRTIMS